MPPPSLPAFGRRHSSFPAVTPLLNPTCTITHVQLHSHITSSFPPPLGCRFQQAPFPPSPPLSSLAQPLHHPLLTATSASSHGNPQPSSTPSSPSASCPCTSLTSPALASSRLPLHGFPCHSLPPPPSFTPLPSLSHGSRVPQLKPYPSIAAYPLFLCPDQPSPPQSSRPHCFLSAISLSASLSLQPSQSLTFSRPHNTLWLRLVSQSLIPPSPASLPASSSFQPSLPFCLPRRVCLTFHDAPSQFPLPSQPSSASHRWPLLSHVMPCFLHAHAWLPSLPSMSRLSL